MEGSTKNFMTFTIYNRKRTIIPSQKFQFSQREGRQRNGPDEILTLASFDSKIGPAFAIYCEWKAKPELFTSRAKIPSPCNFSTNLFTELGGPEMVTLSLLLWQATVMSFGMSFATSVWESPVFKVIKWFLKVGRILKMKFYVILLKIYQWRPWLLKEFQSLVNFFHASRWLVQFAPVLMFHQHMRRLVHR